MIRRRRAEAQRELAERLSRNLGAVWNPFLDLPILLALVLAGLSGDRLLGPAASVDSVAALGTMVGVLGILFMLLTALATFGPQTVSATYGVGAARVLLHGLRARFLAASYLVAMAVDLTLMLFQGYPPLFSPCDELLALALTIWLLWCTASYVVQALAGLRPGGLVRELCRRLDTEGLGFVRRLSVGSQPEDPLIAVCGIVARACAGNETDELPACFRAVASRLYLLLEREDEEQFRSAVLHVADRFRVVGNAGVGLLAMGALDNGYGDMLYGLLKLAREKGPRAIEVVYAWAVDIWTCMEWQITPAMVSTVSVLAGATLHALRSTEGDATTRVVLPAIRQYLQADHSDIYSRMAEDETQAIDRFRSYVMSLPPEHPNP